MPLGVVVVPCRVRGTRGKRRGRPSAAGTVGSVVNAGVARALGTLAAVLVAALVVAVPGQPADDTEPPHVLVVEFDNDVNPVTQDFLQDAIERGEQEEAAAVVIEMDTPGGLGSAMREIVKSMLAAEVPGRRLRLAARARARTRPAR